MKTDKERTELKEQLRYLYKDCYYNKGIEVVAVTKIQEYEQPYIDRIKELEDALTNTLKILSNCIPPIEGRETYSKIFIKYDQYFIKD